MTETQSNTEIKTETKTPVPPETTEQLTHILGRGRPKRQSVIVETRGPLRAAAIEAATEDSRTDTPDTPDTPEASEPEGVDEMLDTNVANVEAFARATEAMIKGMANVNAEMARFAEDRIRANFERMQSLLKTSDPADVVELQVNFARLAAEQYFTEATRLLNLAAQVTEESWAPIKDRVDEEFGIVSKK
jgi:phasin family protein